MTELPTAPAWSSIAPAQRFGRTLTEDACEHLRPGTLLRVYTPDPWFEPGGDMPALGQIVVFTGAISRQYPAVGPHLEVASLAGRTYPGGGWVFRLFQFVADPPGADRPPPPTFGDVGEQRQWLARQLLDDHLSDAEAFGIAAFHPSVKAARKVGAFAANASEARCAHHPDRPSRVNLDGDELCQECADAWARSEGDHQAWLEAEEAPIDGGRKA